MNPTPEEIALIRARVSDWAPASAALADELNAATIPNPTPARMIPREVGSMDVLSQLSPASMVKVINFQHLGLVKQAITERNRVSMLEWVDVLSISPGITPDEAARCRAVINTDIPDPAWQEFVSWAQIELGRAVDEADVQAARLVPKVEQVRAWVQAEQARYEARITMLTGAGRDLSAGVDVDLAPLEVA